MTTKPKDWVPTPIPVVLDRMQAAVDALRELDALPSHDEDVYARIFAKHGVSRNFVLASSSDAVINDAVFNRGALWLLERS